MEEVSTVPIGLVEGDVVVAVPLPPPVVAEDTELCDVVDVELVPV